MENTHIGIIGAGVVGLSSALFLQKAGYRVTLIDKEGPGTGASLGNAGLFAEFSRLPFTSFGMLRKMPGMLLDGSSPLSIQGNYIPPLVSYGWKYLKSCFPEHYNRGKAALTALQQDAMKASQTLVQEAGAQDLVRANGCLGLYTSEKAFKAAQSGDLNERRELGVNLQFLSAAEVKELEPDIAGFHVGGVFYPDTLFTVDPLALCRQYARHFCAKGGTLLQDKVQFIRPSEQGVAVQVSDEVLSFDQVVVCAGVASKKLLKPLGVNIPLVSERGYHLTLDVGGQRLNRPVGWLDKSVYLTPMSDGVRVAGSAEFADSDAPLNFRQTEAMLGHAKVMLGRDPEVKSTWVGSRPSTPDSLPVIGPVEHHPRITLAFGHGHLGLTLGAITGQLIAESVRGGETSVDLTPFSPSRFD